MKGVKVILYDAEPQIRRGFAATSLQSLKDKVTTKLLNQHDELRLFLPDGTEIDDEEYFSNLENQSVVYATQSKKLDLLSLDQSNFLDAFLTQLRWQDGAKEVVDQVRQLLSDQTKWQAMTAYMDGHKEAKCKAKLSSRLDDPDWFQDTSTNAQTKEEFLTKGCQARIRGYLAKAEAGLKEQKQSLNEITRILGEFRHLLKQHRYNGHYFDRRSTLDRICDENGLFRCEGRYDEVQCKYGPKGDLKDLEHSINPYESNEARIMFSTWNLDHVIERSRTIVPTLVDALKKCPKTKEINVNYFYELLFTRLNLKLVHIVCHDKQEHLSKKCDSKLIYLKRNSKKRKYNYN